jgi:hypothetical protein
MGYGKVRSRWRPIGHPLSSGIAQKNEFQAGCSNRFLRGLMFRRDGEGGGVSSVEMRTWVGSKQSAPTYAGPYKARSLT